MSNKETGGPAFPVADPFLLKPGNEKRMMEIAGGMTLRDYFAAKVLHGLIAASGNSDGTVEFDDDIVVTTAWKMADAMLKARQS